MFLVLEIFNLYLFCNIVAAFSIYENVDNFSDLVKYQVNVDEWLYKVNSDYLNFNRLSSNLSWQQTVNPDDTNIEMINKLGSLKVKWIKNVCNQVKHLEERVLLPEQQRQLYLLCRGPNYTLHEINELTKIQTLMYEIYTSTEVCTKDEQYCYKGEPDLERIMSNPNSTPETLLWAWTNWHNEVGTQIRQVYPEFVQLMNIGAQRQSYHDIGEVWREELEIDNLETFVLELYEDIAPLYNDLHALIRYKLLKKYGPDIIDPYGLIPAHLLGNMWAQDWSSLISLLIGDKFDLESKIQSKNWTSNEMVRKAEDFYISMNLSRMTDKFWKYSRFEKQTDKNVSCHGTAADLFATNDYRIIMCVDATLNDFYVIHHELGHIEYYMAYRDQPPIFREGTNSAFQESIGDTIMLGVMSPFHLHRLGLINDHQLMDPEYNMILLLYQALSKIPQIPYALLLDQYRWKIFNGQIEYTDMNRIYWRLNNVLRGIQSPVPRDETQFDAGAKFHIADNTPYIRYFLSYVLQFQIFKGMCDMAIFGKPLDDEFDQRKITFPLNRCDIYGSKPAGKKLRKFMEKGAGKHWTKILPIITGTNKISTKPLLAYFNPLHKWLKKQIRTFQIPVGW